MFGSPDMEAIERDAQRVWNSEAAIRAEFGEFSTYAAWRRADARGAVRIVGQAPTVGAAATTAPEISDEQLRRQWENDAAARQEFGGSFGAYAAYTRAEAAGLVRVHGNTGRQPSKPAAAPASTPEATQAGTLTQRQAAVRQENAGRRFAGLPQLDIPQN